MPLPAAISVAVGAQRESQKPERRLPRQSDCLNVFPDIFAIRPSNGIDNQGDTVIYQLEQDGILPISESSFSWRGSYDQHPKDRRPIAQRALVCPR